MRVKKQKDRSMPSDMRVRNIKIEETKTYINLQTDRLTEHTN